MGRRPNPFSKRSLSAFAKQSPNSKIGSGIFLIVLSIIGIIIGIIMVSNTEYSIIGVPLILPSIAMLIGGMIFCGIGSAEKSEQKAFEEAIIKSNMSEIDRMDGKTFEKYLAALFKSKGYNAELTKASGDYGVDVILYSASGTKIIIQAKCYSNKVPISAIQEISAARSYYGTDNAWVITNNFFTQPAINLAHSNNIKLIDRKALADLINSTEGTPTIPQNEIITTVSPRPQKRVIHKINNTNDTDSVKTLNSIIAQNDYNNWYSEKLLNLKNEAILLYGKSDFDGVSSKILEAESLERKSEKNNISLHFFYQDILGIVYALRYNFENAIDECLKLCDKDIEILKSTNIKGFTTYALSRKAIIYEKQGKLQEAIDVCDYGISHNFLDNGKPFILRKERLLKKLNTELSSRNT